MKIVWKNVWTATAILSMLMKGMVADAQQIHQFSLQECLDYARKNNTQVKNALLDIQIQRQTNREITASAYPQINGNVSLIDNLNLATQLIPGEFFGQPAGTFVPLKFGTIFNLNGGVTLQQVLFDGQVFVGLQARKAAIDFYVKTAEVTEQTIRTNIYKTYYQLSASKTQLQILDANIAQLQKLQHDNEVMYKNGFAEQIDVNRAGVQLANVQTQKDQAISTIENGFLGLKILMGMPMKDSLILTDSVTYDQIKSGVLENLTYNYRDRKEYQLAEIASQLRAFDVKRYKYTYYPTVNLNANYAENAQRNKFTFFKSGQQWFTSSYVSLNINIPIFDGFARSARVQRAKLNLQEAQNNIDGLKQTIDRDVSQAINNYNTAIRTLDNQKRNMELAELVYSQSKKKFEAGLGSQLDITSAQTDLQVAQNNYINAMYTAIVAKGDFLNATGKLQ